jgi:hypothetical protein
MFNQCSEHARVLNPEIGFTFIYGRNKIGFYKDGRESMKYTFICIQQLLFLAKVGIKLFRKSFCNTQKKKYLTDYHNMNTAGIPRLKLKFL